MNTFLRGSLFLTIAAILALSPSASASSMDDLSWFGHTGATPDPVKDANNPGYWWWPTAPDSSNGDQEIWGNRGVVYNMFTITPPPVPPTPPPVATPAPVVKRSIPVANAVLFDLDKSDLKAASKQEINRVADIMEKNPGDTVTIEGHTCDLGKDEYNTGLGQRRADAVSGALIAAGIDASRITSVSKGESSPAVANDGEANRSKNRRVVFLFKIK